jgi:hypothetical protein
MFDAALVSVVPQMCVRHIFAVTPSHLRFISSSFAATFGVSLKNPQQVLAARSFINTFMTFTAPN